MTNSEFVEVGTARLSRSGRAVQISLYLLNARLFIDKDRVKGIMENKVEEAPIWVLREDEKKLKQKRPNERKF